MYEWMRILTRSREISAMSETVVRTYRSGDFEFLAVENNEIRAVFLPEIGSKMVELRNLKTEKQFLLAPQSPARAYSRPAYGADFASFDTSGFDECFPTVSTSHYRSLTNREKTYDIVFPDHGELWSRPWEVHRGEGEVRFSIRGVRGEYDFEKRVEIRRNALTLHYALRNLSKDPFSYIWSAHPLLDVSPNVDLLLPAEIDTVLLNWSSDPSVGRFGDRISWPNLLPARRGVSFARVQESSLGVAVKCFTDALHEGRAGIYDRTVDESLLLEFNPRENPYLGLWLCYGGWPVNAERRHLTAALEPCSGRPDSLEEAVLRRECAELPGGCERTWSLSLSLWKGRPSRHEQS
jgi:hypothetical protein